MIELDKGIRRCNWFWDGVGDKQVARYRKELNSARESLKQGGYEIERLLMGRDSKVREEINSLIDSEIQLCDFYAEYAEKKDDPKFNTWFHVKQKDRQGLGESEWESKKGDCWVKHNGKLRAKITLDESGLMTKVTLVIENNSSILTFYSAGGYGGSKEIASSHLKNEESINRRVGEYKSKAEDLMREHQYPSSDTETREIDILKGLVHYQE